MENKKIAELCVETRDKVSQAVNMVSDAQWAPASRDDHKVCPKGLAWSNGAPERHRLELATPPGRDALGAIDDGKAGDIRGG